MPHRPTPFTFKTANSKVEGPESDFTFTPLAQLETEEKAQSDVVTLFSCKVEEEPYRTTSDGGTKYLGNHGVVSVSCHTSTHTHYFHYHDANKVEMVKCRLPRSKLAAIIQGNAGHQNAWFLDGHNEAHAAGGTGIVGQQGNTHQIGLRRFYFFLPAQWQLAIFLHHAFYEDDALVEEFFTHGSRFHAVKETFAPHKAVKNNGTEEYDEDMNKIKPRKAPLTDEEELEEYGVRGCGGYSQEY